MQKILIAVVVVVVVLGGGYYFVFMSSPAAEKASTSPANATKGNTEGVVKVQVEVATQPTVTLKNFAFSPKEIRVKAGTKVMWANEDLAGHSVTSDSGAFASRILSQGKTFEHTFAQKGTFSYHCEPHPFMTGTVIVE